MSDGNRLEKLRAELKDEFREESKDELRTESKDELRAELKDEFRAELKDELRAELKDEFRAELKDELRAELKDEFREESKDELREELKDELRAELKDELREERKDEFREELKDELREELKDEFEAENERLQERVDEQSKRIEDLESEPSFEITDETDPIKTLHVEGAPIGRAIQSKPSKNGVEQRLDELKADLEASTPTPEGEKTDSTDRYEPKTSLEQVVSLPEAMAVEQLSANQERARFIAADVRDYADSVPAGWVITSTDLRRVLQAYDESGHTETVARVFDILDDLGGDEVEIVDRRGTKRIAFSNDLVNRLDRVPDGHDVVIEAEG